MYQFDQKVIDMAMVEKNAYRLGYKTAYSLFSKIQYHVRSGRFFFKVGTAFRRVAPNSSMAEMIKLEILAKVGNRVQRYIERVGNVCISQFFCASTGRSDCFVDVR